MNSNAMRRTDASSLLRERGPSRKKRSAGAGPGPVGLSAGMVLDIGRDRTLARRGRRARPGTLPRLLHGDPRLRELEPGPDLRQGIHGGGRHLLLRLGPIALG